MQTEARVLLAWSSGKDSAWALHTLRQSEGIEVVGLLTTVNQAFERIAMHAVRVALLQAQAEAVGLPLIIAPIPWPCSNEQYEQSMRCALTQAREQLAITHVAFGDLYLEDVRKYREDRMEGTPFKPLFPLWGMDTCDLSRKMIDSGLKARVTCVDPSKLDASFAGRDFDAGFLADLPAGVDPCAESGEFHTFAYDGPMFQHALQIETGEIVERDGFVFADILPCS